MIRWVSILLTCAVAAASDYVLPAFPEVSDYRGAEGWGMATTGGRGGQVIFVTTTNSTGPGSFYAAMKATGPRMVLIRVAGWTTLTSELTLYHANRDVTVFGGLAPGEGFGVRGQTMSAYNAGPITNAIFRFMRFRHGTYARVGVNGSDAVSFGSDGIGTTNLIFANCTIGWGSDESMSIRNAQFVTVQDCIYHETFSLASPTTGYGAYGGINGGSVSVLRNAFFHLEQRCPALRGLAHAENNVVYNSIVPWTTTLADTMGGSSALVVRNNYIRYGPARASWPFPSQTPGILLFLNDNSAMHLTGNTLDGYAAQTANNALMDQSTTRTYTGAPTKPFFTSLTAAESVGITNLVGASRPARDSVDTRLMHEFRTATATYGTAGYGITAVSQVGGFPVYSGTRDYNDSDADGMDDDWERDNFNGSLDRDGRGYYKNQPGYGYTDLECYLYNIDPNDERSWRRDFYTGAWERGDIVTPPPPPPPPPVTGSVSLNGKNQLNRRVRILRE